MIIATCQIDLPQKSCQATKLLNGDKKTRRILTKPISIRSFAAENGAGWRPKPLAAFDLLDIITLMKLAPSYETIYVEENAFIFRAPVIVLETIYVSRN